MQTITNKQIYDRWEQIPEDLKEAFFSTDNGEIIWKACEDAGLSEEVIDDVLIVFGNVLLGFTHVNELSKELQSIPGMDPKAIDPIIFQIDRRIFAPIKGEILKLYGDMSGTGPRMMAEEKTQAVEIPDQPKMVVENAVRPSEPVSEGAPAALQATQFETRKIKIDEESPIEAPAMIHTEQTVAPVVAKKRELSSFGGVFGFHRKSSPQSEGPAVTAQVSMVQGLGRKPEEMGRTEQQPVRVVHYTSAQGPEDMFGQTKPQAQQSVEAVAPVIDPISTFEPKAIDLGEGQMGGNAIAGQQKETPAQQDVVATIPTAQSQQIGRAVEVAPPVMVMKTPQRPEPIEGAVQQAPEPRLTEIPVADDIVDLRMLERATNEKQQNN